MSHRKSEGGASRIGAWGCLLAMVLSLILVPVAGIGIYRVRSSSRVEAALATARGEGMPTTAEELEAYYSLPEGATDTAMLWQTATAPFDSPQYAASAGDLPIVGTGTGDVPPPGQPWPQEEQAKAHLARHAASLKMMHEAAKIGDPARYPTDFRRGIAMLLPHAQALRGGVRLLDLEARVRARQGDAEGAAESLHAVFKAAHSLEREPVLVSQLVRFACHSVGVQTLEELLPHVEFSDEELAQLQADLEAPDFQGSLQRAVVGERVIGVTTFRSPELHEQEVGRVFGRVLAKTTSVARHDDLAFYLNCMERYHAASKKPWPQAVKDLDAIEQTVHQQTSGALGKARYTTTALLVPTLGAAFEAAFRNEAQTRAAATAVAVQRYRLKHGKLPDKLDQLVPEFLPAVLSDPFDGQPLRYSAGDDEFTVYSIGKNGVDDRGREHENRGEPDIAFTVRSPAE